MSASPHVSKQFILLVLIYVLHSNQAFVLFILDCYDTDNHQNISIFDVFTDIISGSLHVDLSYLQLENTMH